MSTVFNIILLLKPACRYIPTHEALSNTLSPINTVSYHGVPTPQNTQPKAKTGVRPFHTLKFVKFRSQELGQNPSGRIYCAQTAATLHTVSLGCYSEVMGHTMMPR
jgi:hypothetical protein